ncbi:MAG: RNA-binding S4 domain-containing protein [Bacteroidia bacterium]
MRIDKWLWAVRIFKTRSLASEACDKGKVRVGDSVVKASRNLKPADKVSYSYGSLTRTFEVKALLENRVGAKEVANYCIETTPAEELLKHEAMRKAAAAWRDKGAGRPTKKDRRELDDFIWGGNFDL